MGAPFAESAAFAAALCCAFWPLARRTRALVGRRASSLAMAALISAGAGLPGAWAWNRSFLEIDAMVAAFPQPAGAAAGSSSWGEGLREAARGKLSQAAASPEWRAHVKSAGAMPWGQLGLLAILSYFMCADGLGALARARVAAARCAPAGAAAAEAFCLAFLQTSRACVWFGAASALLLWWLFWWAGAPSPMALAVAAACASMLPFVAPVMVAAVALALMSPGNWAGPAALLLAGAGGLGLANNILRPQWIGEASGLPMPVALLGMAGGAIAWGPAGLLAGPAIAAAALQCLEGSALRG